MQRAAPHVRGDSEFDATRQGWPGTHKPEMSGPDERDQWSKSAVLLELSEGHPKQLGQTCRLSGMASGQYDVLTERIRRYPSAERLTLLRNVGYGGAALCLAVLVGLTQVGAKDAALRLSVYSASIALPLWLLIGGLYEYCIFLGKQSYPHLRTTFMTRLVTGLYLAASSAMFAITAGIVWFLSSAAAYMLAASAFIAIIALAVFHAHLARWWAQQIAPKDGSDA